jgi:Protein of unknown function (DUF3108)
VLFHLFSVSFLSLLSAAALSAALPLSIRERVESRAPLPFVRGERFNYDISWLYVKAGTAVMAVEESPVVNDHRTLRLLTTAQSSPMVTRFYPVNNRVESIVDLDTFLPARMIFNRREGKRKNDFEYTFHHREGTVTAVKDGKTDVLPLPQDAQDAISCLYFVRKSLPLTPGASLTLNVHHDKKNYKLAVQVEALETIEGPWGKSHTARVLAIMPFQGIFLNEGNVRVWFTTDEHRIPVRMKAKVIIGSIVADLVSGFDPVEKS